MTLTHPDTPAPHVAYLTSAYPAVSHVFIEREVEALRRRGVTVSTFAIRRTPRNQLLTDDAVRIAGETYALLPLRRVRFAVAHLTAVLRGPRAYAATLRRALGMSPGGLRAGLWQVFYFAEAIMVWHEARRRGIRHIHAHFANVACAVAMLAADFGAAEGFRWSFTMHGPTEFDDVSRYALAEKVRDAAFVACISEFCRSQLMKLAAPEEWDKLAIVRCGLGAGELARHAEPGSDPDFRVLCIGRLVPEKGQLMLARAVAQLVERGLAVRLTFVGDGPMADSLRDEVARLGITKRTTMLGSLGRDRVAEAYRHADAFCLPSFSEGVPVVLMEAMAAGLPVVTTRIAGIAELVLDGENGALVAPGRSEPIADALERLARDRQLGARWGRAGRERVQHAYDVACAAELLHELFATRGAAARG